MSRSVRFLLLSILSLPWLCPMDASAQVRRCVMPDGRSVFTDRACTDIGAVERLPRAEASAGAARAYRGGCARNLQDLVFEMTTAIDARDANRLANVYHWPGLSGSTAYAIWSRLDMVVNRPLVDIAPVMPRSREPEPIIVDGSDVDADAGAPAGRAKSSTDTMDDDLYPQTTVRRTPIGLRVEQTLGKSSTPSRTVFGLTRHFGCWWIRF